MSLLELLEIRCGYKFEGQTDELGAIIDEFILKSMHEQPDKISNLFIEMSNHQSKSERPKLLARFAKYIENLLNIVWIRDLAHEIEFALRSPHFIEIAKCIEDNDQASKVVGDTWAQNFRRIGQSLRSTKDEIFKGKYIFKFLTKILV